MVSLLRLLNMMTFLSDNFRYSVFKNGSNVTIIIDDPLTFDHVEIAYVFTMGFLSYFSRISSNITLRMHTGGKHMHIGGEWTYEKLGRKHFPVYCDL
jgi:hypothetical protein